jgi:hypothetical protein
MRASASWESGRPTRAGPSSELVDAGHSPEHRGDRRLALTLGPQLADEHGQVIRIDRVAIAGDDGGLW